jgi:hypothetical protein
MPVEFAESRSRGVMDVALHVGDVRGWAINAHTMRVGGRAAHGEATSKGWRQDLVSALALLLSLM